MNQPMTHMIHERLPTAGPSLILAGGKARRLGGGDKGTQLLAGRPILTHICARLAPQSTRLLLNSNGDLGRWTGFGLPVIPDSLQGHLGPLAGVLSGLQWMRENAPHSSHLLTVPTDTPFLPLDLRQRLTRASFPRQAEIAYACSETRAHYVIALWCVDLIPALEDALKASAATGKGLSLRQWIASRRYISVPWPSVPINPFYNINTPEELAEAEALLARHGLPLPPEPAPPPGSDRSD